MNRVGNKIQNVLEFLKQIKQLQRLFKLMEHLFMLLGGQFHSPLTLTGN